MCTGEAATRSGPSIGLWIGTGGMSEDPRNAASIYLRASLVPAAAVIPAQVAYLDVVAVKKLVVGWHPREVPVGASQAFGPGRAPLGSILWCPLHPCASSPLWCRRVRVSLPREVVPLACLWRIAPRSILAGPLLGRELRGCKHPQWERLSEEAEADVWSSLPPGCSWKTLFPRPPAGMGVDLAAAPVSVFPGRRLSCGSFVRAMWPPS